MHVSYMLVAMDNNRMKQVEIEREIFSIDTRVNLKEISIQEGRLRLLEVEYEYTKKLNQQLRLEQNEAFGSRRLFPHVFRKDTMPV